MLQITISGVELYDEKTETFTNEKERTLQLEHSLLSVSKWESKWNKSFLSTKEKTFEETIDYIKCMTITQNVPDSAYNLLTKQNIDEIQKYIAAPMTATCFMETDDSDPNTERITSELIYYWMISMNIPFECQKWHLNRLLTLIKVCGIKNNPPKKLGMASLMRRNTDLNKARRAMLNTKG